MDRHKDAAQMHAVFQRAQSRARRQRNAGSRAASKRGPGWRQIQWREFQRKFKSQLDTRYQCRRCDGPVAECMQACPWCGIDNPSRGNVTRMPTNCPRCERGVKLDWDYCAWCFGPGFEPETNRYYSDVRYVTRCKNRRCQEPQMPFMRYCPWCKSKVKSPWKIEGSKDRCRACRWGIAGDYWKYCAWCREPVQQK